MAATFKTGDLENDIIRKILITVGGTFSPGDQKYTMLRKILVALGGTFKQGDLQYTILRKIVTQVGGHPVQGDLEYDLLRKWLQAVTTTFRQGDQQYDIYRKLLVVSNNGGMVPIPPGPPVPVVCAQGVALSAAWAARVIVNGGAGPSAATTAAIADFICGCIADGTWNKFLGLNVFAPDNLIACQTPLIVSPTGGDPWVNEGGNFVGGDLTVNGLTGNAINKTLLTGMQLKSFAPQNTGGFAWYAYNATNTGVSLGVYDETAGMLGYAKFSGNSSAANGLTGGVNQITVASLGNGFYSDVRTGATDHRLYFASGISPHAQIGATDVVNWSGTFSIFGSGFQIFALLDTLGSQQLFSSDTISFVAFYQGFTAADSANLFTRVQALRVAFGGGFR